MKERKLTEKWALAFLRDMLATFPGLLTDEEVNGGDLVQWVTNALSELEQGKK